jgi:hypothetical protein
MGISLLLLLFFWLAAIARRQLTGFAFNTNRLEDLNVLRLAGITILPFLLWTVANWSVCTLFDGDGKYRDIWIISSYSLLPYVILSFLSVALSNVVTIDEGIFVGWIDVIGMGWSIMLLLSGLMTIHQYSFLKTVSTSTLTVVGVFLIVLTFLLVFNLYQQVFQFFHIVFREITYRL